MMSSVISATLFMGGLGAALTSMMYVIVRWQRDAPGAEGEIELLKNLLPGNDCGACGLAGCAAMARALWNRETLPHQCPVASTHQVERLRQALGLAEGTPAGTYVARVVCGGTEAVAPDRAIYEGVLDCRAADIVGKGNKACVYGCLGMGTCVRLCPFGAIFMSHDGLPRVDETICTGCGLCAASCPRGVMQLLPVAQSVFVRCRATALGKQVRAVCQVGCIACHICARTCQRGKIDLIDNLATIDATLCIGCGDCAVKCPTGTIVDLKAVPIPSNEEVHV